MPTPVPDPVDTIERFAELSALLEDPFADEEKVLRSAGLDSGAWDAIQRRWMARISSSAEAAALSGRFGAVYVATKERLARGAASEGVPPTEPALPGFLSAVVPDAGGEPPPVPHAPVFAPATRTTSTLADTLESAQAIPLPPLPFEG
jgi:hypothetical protein